MLQFRPLRLITFVLLHRPRTLTFLLQLPLILLPTVSSLILPHLRTAHRLLKETRYDFNLLLVMCCLTRQLTIGASEPRTSTVQANSVTGLLPRVSLLIWPPQLIVGSNPTVVSLKGIL